VRGGKKKLDVDYRGMRFNIYFAMPFYWGAMLFFLTGPASYAIAYRRKAKTKGWHLDQYGLKNEKGEVIASRTEASIYKAFDKSYKQPELRGK
jgi:DNA polymerase/3'-5' exonuclease PolX